MENNFQPTLQQQLAAAQQQIQQLADQNMQANGEIARLRALNPQTTQTNPAIPLHLPRPPLFQQNQFRAPQAPPMPQAPQAPPMPQTSHNNLRPPQNNNSQPIFPPLPSGPPPAFTFAQPHGVPRPFHPIPEPIPHIPTTTTTITHIPIQPNNQEAVGMAPMDNHMDVRLKMLEEQNKAMLALLAKLPGAVVPVEVEPKTGFQASPYVDEIALMDIPEKYNIPTFTTKYSGITDPVEHVAQYKQLMWTTSIPSQYQEACMCKSIGSTLIGAALQWLINLKPKSIESFAELVNHVTRQFASSRKMEKQTSDLYYVVQKTGETIRDYFNRFNAEMIEVKNGDIKTAIEAYKRGLDSSSELYTYLTKYPPENFDDVRARTLAHMRIEDDAIFRRKHSIEKKNLGAQKHDFKPKRVNKIGNSRQEFKARSSKSTGTSKELVDSLRKIDANVRWPKKPENPSKDKDQTKWCEFHGDHGHTTDECISLKKEIAYLKSNGHLKGILSDEVKRPASPIHTKVVNCITGGSEQNDTHEKGPMQGYPIPKESKTVAERELDAAKLTFDQDDLSGLNQKHHDALVIQLTIGNCLTKRVLVDGGSSANVIFADTLKIMGIDRSNTVRRTTTLVGFNGDATNTLGEIVLPVFAKGINKQTKTVAERELDAAKLTFDQDDLSGLNPKHHDALVIQLTIGNCLTKRVLVDGGSSSNVIFADTLKIMGIDRSNIVRRTTTLVGFNGDATNTLGEIVLPVIAKGINKQTKTVAERELDAAKLTFDQDDLSGLNQKHHDALVIQLTIGNCLTKRVLVDGGSSANVIFADTLKIMGIDRSNIVRRTTTLVGFNGDATNTLGEIVLPVFAKGINKQTKFNVIDCPSAYNAILGRPWIHDMKAVPSTYHQKIKFPSPWGSQDRVRSYDDLQLEEFVLDQKQPDRKVFVGATLTPDIKSKIISFLHEHSDCFTWSHEDMVGIDPDIISHKLNVDPSFKPVKQKRRKFAPERNKVINDKVDNLLKTGKIREVKYPDWLANVVVIQKKNAKWRVCIDFTDLNKARPKDLFPLPHIDAMVDATAGHELLTFMDA
ncbi:hypothetical protein OSB04_016884 [Centaurea solstitialis]|uniref:Retrotransposon gag domain-containing protein n=1 Tax=Centaurea solstitialis TaxID=347529 RepID=A0AA38T1V3_9ASTR|nr:hypothetical protein OSB04_016884 [Centaurea solstitialis]